MPDIFLSYAHENKIQAGNFAKSLIDAGFDLWWDEAVRPGEDFDQAIDDALNAARAVIVLWSPDAVRSRWVRSEAAVGLRNDALVPVMIADCTLPVMFELSHTINLTNWQGDTRAHAWQDFLDRLKQQIKTDNARAAANTGAQLQRRQIVALSAAPAMSNNARDALDPEEWHTLMDSFRRSVDQIAAKFGQPGVLHESSHSFICFGLVDEREDDGIMAIRAGLELTSLGNAGAKSTGAQELCIGIAAGSMLVGSATHPLTGATINISRELSASADAGKILISGPVARLADGYFDLVPAGNDVFAVQAESIARTRFERSRARGLSHFIGRQAPLSLLSDVLQQTLASESQIVGIMGDAGIGKSRLCFEFAERLRATGCTVVQASATLDSVTMPLLVARDIARSLFAEEYVNGADGFTERISERVIALDPRLANSLSSVFDLLDLSASGDPPPLLDPEARLRQLAALMRHMLARASQEQPVLVVVEDMHWLDHASASFLEVICAAGDQARVMFLFNYRPEFRADWLQSRRFRQLILDPLSTEDVGALLENLVGSDPKAKHLVKPIGTLTGGNPFFIEEIVRTLAETGELSGAPGRYALTRDVAKIKIPPAISSVVSARIARLTPVDRTILQIAAIAGFDFPQKLITAAGPLSDGATGNALARLQKNEFILEKSYFPEARFGFRHPLLQEVASQSLSNAARREAHAAVAASIETMMSGELDGQAPSLARHWEEARNVQKAIHWHSRAAELASRTDFFASAAHWERVRALGKENPEDAVAQQLALNACIQLLNMNVRVGINLEAADAILADGVALAKAPEQAPLRTLLALCHARALAACGDAEAFYAGVTANLEAARQSGDEGLRTVAQMLLCDALTHTGRNHACIAEAEAGLAMLPDSIPQAEWIRGYNPRTFFRFMRGIALSWVGRLDDSVADLRQANEQAIRDETPEVCGWCHYGLSVTFHYLGDFEQALDAAKAAQRIADQLGSPLLVAYGSLAEIWAWLTLDKAPPATLDQAVAVRDLLQRVERHWEGVGAVLHARLLLANGERERAFEVAEEAVALCAQSGIDQFAVEALGVIAKGHAAAGELNIAENAMARARHIAESRGNDMLLPVIGRWSALLNGK